MTKILLAKELGPNLTTRSSLRAILDAATGDKIEVDFKGIAFISRSCADEYLKFKETLAKGIVERNVSPEIEQMFSLVRHSRTAQTEERFRPSPVATL